MAISLFNQKIQETTEIEAGIKDLFETTMINTMNIGPKKMAFIPVKLLFVDKDFQRTESYDKSKVDYIVSHFDENKMEPLLVSIHKDECRYSVLNGMHRLYASIKKGKTHVVCYIVELPEKDRKKQEAWLFLSQQEGVDRMKPRDKHKGLVLLGDPTALLINEVINESEGKCFLKENIGRGKGSKGEFTNYDKLYRVAKDKYLKDIMEIMYSINWHTETGGLGGRALSFVNAVYKTHKSNPNIKKEIAKVLIGYTPQNFLTQAKAAYPMRSEHSALCMYLEDWVCSNLGIERLININVSNRFNPMAPVA